MGAVITGEGVIVGTGVATGVAGWLHPQTINERKMSAASINRLIWVKWESRGINVVNFYCACETVFEKNTHSEGVKIVRGHGMEHGTPAKFRRIDLICNRITRYGIITGS